MPGRIVIFTALQYEAKRLAQSLATDGSIELRVIGPGAAKLPAKADLSGARLIIMAGLAGALDPALQIGDVVAEAGDDSLDDIKGPWRRGRIHTADQIVSTPAQKRSLFAATGALVVDMENARVGKLAEDIGVPFISIRAVSDRADETLEPAVLCLLDSSGRLRASRLARELLHRPQLLITLLRLQRRSSLAMKNLVQALTQLLAGQSGSGPLLDARHDSAP